MEIKVISGDITRQPANAIIVNLFQGVQTPGGATGAVDKALGGAISQLIAEGEIRGKRGEVTIVHTLGKILPARVAVVGLGKQEDFSLDVVRSVMGEACRRLRAIGASRVATIIHGAGIGGLNSQEAAQAIAEGSILGLYRFRRHFTKSEDDEREVQELDLIEIDIAKVRALEKGVAIGKEIGEATALARDMVNEPANHMTPSHMAEVARKAAGEAGLEITVLELSQIDAQGMGGLLAVAQGSVQQPRFIILRYWGDRGNPSNNLGLLGKGITFDSGGISLKPPEGLAEMKGDMAGGAAVISAMRAIGKLKPRINVTGLVPATENLPSGSAVKPGDVIRAMNGKSIEVDNTDAEGRLVLGDALCYARQLGMGRLVDAATLTGAMRIALGTVCTGAFTNNDVLMQQVIKAGEKAGDRIWQLPMYEEYREQNKSQVADVKNTGGRSAGAITAAFFLREFAEDTPWVHLDIAGTSTTDTSKGYNVKGATGVPVRTFVQLALDLAQEKG